MVTRQELDAELAYCGRRREWLSNQIKSVAGQAEFLKLGWAIDEVTKELKEHDRRMGKEITSERN